MATSFSKIVIGLLFGSGCIVTGAQQMEAARVRVLQPRPLVDLPVSSEAMSLEMDARVLDQFIIPEQNGGTAVPVEGWRASLANGFAAGPAQFFLGKPGTAPTWRLVIVSADLDYTPTSMFARNGVVTGAATAIARLRYMARIVAPNGDVVARDQGEVFSTSQWIEYGGSSTTAAEAIGAMYQQIASKIPAS